MGHALTAKEIFDSNDIAREKVDVPEWSADPNDPDYVLVQTMSGKARDHWEITISKASQEGRLYRGQSLRAAIAVESCVDEEGNRLFTPKDIEKLGQKSSVPLDRIYEAALRVSKLRDADVEDLEKNSAGGQSD